ncbi:MAG: GNAT family N-acetyltransferase [Proteobacteria bacterium]|nr:GNAT family N-acetyltransferase [Pseudomonadota bacterium]
MSNAEQGYPQAKIVSPEEVIKRIEPGMNIFLGTGLAEPRTLVKHLMASDADNLQDLTLIQLVSLGDAISIEELQSQRHRLKTFFSGWVVSDAITAGRVDLIPSRFSRIPALIASGQIPIDVAFVQITPPNQAGYSSLGIAVDVARYAMEEASLVVGEINPKIPLTFGDTFIPVTDFDLMVQSQEDPYYFQRWPVDETFDRISANVASVIEDGDCIAFSLGPLFEGLAKHLIGKRQLGIHSPFFTDPLMDLVKSGAVTNRYKEIFRGKSLASYAIGSQELMAWLDRNPLVEFQAIDRVFNPVQIGKNPRLVAILPARKVDLSGRIALHFGKGNVEAGPVEAVDFFTGAGLSQGGRTVIALPSRNRNQEPNLRLSVEGVPNLFSLQASVDMVITEYGTAVLKGRTVRERAQALIDIAHPDDRPVLVEEAKKENILYHDQIFIKESAHFYPAEIAEKHIFKNDVKVQFRAIKPSDEENMRRLFYRFSNEAVYYRYFSPIKTMPHSRMQSYVNVNFRLAMSIVGLVEDQIIAEGRFVKDKQRPYADVAFVVDEEYQGLGIASYLLQILMRTAKERGLQGFTADVLASNKRMMKVFEKAGLPVAARLDSGVYELTMPFDSQRTSQLDLAP